MAYDRIDFEAKVAFLERTVDALSDALHAQGQVLEDLERRLAKIEKRASTQDAPEVGPQDAPPPHY